MAEEVWEQAKDDLPGLDLSPVCRSLEAPRAVRPARDGRVPEGPRGFSRHTNRIW